MPAEYVRYPFGLAIQWTNITSPRKTKGVVTNWRTECLFIDGAIMRITKDTVTNSQGLSRVKGNLHARFLGGW